MIRHISTILSTKLFHHEGHQQTSLGLKLLRNDCFSNNLLWSLNSLRYQRRSHSQIPTVWHRLHSPFRNGCTTRGCIRNSQGESFNFAREAIMDIKQAVLGWRLSRLSDNSSESSLELESWSTCRYSREFGILDLSRENYYWNCAVTLWADCLWICPDLR
jgi:hypothetical protein